MPLLSVSGILTVNGKQLKQLKVLKTCVNEALHENRSFKAEKANWTRTDRSARPVGQFSNVTLVSKPVCQTGQAEAESFEMLRWFSDRSDRPVGSF